MKQLLRRAKPPLKLLERNELKHIATLKMKKAAKLICPLCRKPLRKGNTHEVVFNNKPVQVHDDCPGGEENAHNKSE